MNKFLNVSEKTLLNIILSTKANCIGHIFRRNFVLHDAIEGQMMEVRGRRRRRTELIDDLRNKNILGAKRRKLNIEVDETTVYQSNIRNKYISSISP